VRWLDVPIHTTEERMGTERSDMAYGLWRDASDKFDYFITGATGALIAYVGQSIEPVRLGWNQQTVEWLALALLGVSMVFGLKRLESSISIYSVQHRRLYSEEVRAALAEASKSGSVINQKTGEVVSRQQAIEMHEAIVRAGREKGEELIDAALSRYHWRNGILMLGAITLVIARILTAYLGR
jgi:hypothetical protein